MTENERNQLKAQKAADKQRKKEAREQAKAEAKARREARRNRSVVEKLSRAAARYVSMMATTRIVGGGMTGYLASMAAGRGADRLMDSFFAPKTQSTGAVKPQNAESDVPEQTVQPSRVDTADQALSDLEAKARQVDEWRRNLQSPPAADKAAKDIRHNPALDEVFGVKPTATVAGRAGPAEAAAGNAVTRAAANTAAEAAVARGAAAAASGAVAGGAGGGGGAIAGGAGGGGGAIAGGAVAAGGAGAGGGGAMGAAAAAAGPVGLAVAGAAALALVFAKLLEAGKNLAYEQEKHSRHLAEVNPYIAAQQGELDVNRVLRDMQSGDRLAGSNQELLTAIDRYETAMRPLEDIANILKNTAATEALKFITEILEGMKLIAEGQYQAVASVVRIFNKDTPATLDEWIAKLGAGDGSTSTFGSFAQQVYNEEAEIRRRREAAGNANRNIDQEFRRR